MCECARMYLGPEVLRVRPHFTMRVCTAVQIASMCLLLCGSCMHTQGARVFSSAEEALASVGLTMNDLKADTATADPSVGTATRVARQVGASSDCEWSSGDTSGGIRRACRALQAVSADPFLGAEVVVVDPAATDAAPSTPTQGLASMTYVLQGSIEHKDTDGNIHKLQQGDVQWLSAGSGVQTVLSSAPPSARALRLFTNLPTLQKTSDPKCTVLTSASLVQSSLSVDDGSKGTAQATLVAGSMGDATGSVDTSSPLTIAIVEVAQQSQAFVPLSAKQSGLVFVLEGSGWFGGDGKNAKSGVELEAFSMAPIKSPANEGVDADELVVVTKRQAVKFLVAVGEPLDEPVHQQGLVALASKEALGKAMRRYHIEAVEATTKDEL